MGFTRPENAKPFQPHDKGLPCLGCGAKTASQWRGPGKRWCSKGQCPAEAAAAKAAEGPVGKLTARVDTLEAVVVRQTALIDRLLAAVPAAAFKPPRVVPAAEAAAAARQTAAAKAQPSGGAKRGALANLSNGTAPPQPPAKKAAPALMKKADAAAPMLPPGWTTRTSLSQGCRLWEHQKMQLQLRAAPDARRVQEEVLYGLCDKAYDWEQRDDDWCLNQKLLMQFWEECMGREAGSAAVSGFDEALSRLHTSILRNPGGRRRLTAEVVAGVLEEVKGLETDELLDEVDASFRGPASSAGVRAPVCGGAGV